MHVLKLQDKNCFLTAIFDYNSIWVNLDSPILLKFDVILELHNLLLDYTLRNCYFHFLVILLSSIIIVYDVLSYEVPLTFYLKMNLMIDRKKVTVDSNLVGLEVSYLQLDVLFLL